MATPRWFTVLPHLLKIKRPCSMDRSRVSIDSDYTKQFRQHWSAFGAFCMNVIRSSEDWQSLPMDGLESMVPGGRIRHVYKLCFRGGCLFFRIFLSVGGISVPFHSQVSANRIGSYLLPLRFSLDRSVFSWCVAFPSPFTPSSCQDAVQTGELIPLRWGWTLHPSLTWLSSDW